VQLVDQLLLDRVVGPRAGDQLQYRTMKSGMRLFGVALLCLSAGAANLTFRSVPPPRAIVYELPADEASARVVRLLTGGASKIAPGAPLIDASTFSDVALREQLSGTFLLVTLLDAHSRILRDVTQPMPFHIADGRLAFLDFIGPVNDLRVTFVGRNPYGKGSVVVYAAAAPALLEAMDSPPPDFSYRISSGTRPPRQGCYDEHFSPTPWAPKTGVTVAEAREDLEQYFATLERVHPNLFGNADRGEYPRIRQRALDEAVAKVDAGGLIHKADFMAALSHAAAFFQDGHTHLEAPLSPESLKQKQLPPFFLDVRDGHWMIAAANDPALRGLELTAVDGQPILEIFRPVLERTSGETAIFRMAMAAYMQPFSIEHTALVQTAPASYRLALRDGAGREIVRTALSVDFAHYWALLPASARERWQNQAATHVEFPGDSKIARLIYPAFHDSEADRKSIDEAFRKIRDNGATDLIVDLRGNGGGTDTIADVLFSYLYSGPFRQFSEYRVKVSKDVFPDKLPGPEGSTLPHPIGETSHARPEAFFKGRVYLLTDHMTFSTAVSFTTMFRDYRVGKSLGFETGGVPVCSGESKNFTLRHSGIAFTVSDKMFWPPKPRPGDDRHGVIPDVPFTREMLAPYAIEPDPVLAYALQFVRAEN
jgi:hypothetical protein